MLVGAPRAPAALSAFFSSVFAFAATADDNGDGVPDFFGCNNISVAADTLLPAVVVGSVSGAAAARLANASGWLGANQTRALAGLIAGGAALATLHAPHYASALLGPAASTATALATALVGAVCVAEGSAAFWRRHGACVAAAARRVPGARAVGRAARCVRDAILPTPDLLDNHLDVKKVAAKTVTDRALRAPRAIQAVGASAIGVSAWRGSPAGIGIVVASAKPGLQKVLPADVREEKIERRVAKAASRGRRFRALRRRWHRLAAFLEAEGAALLPFAIVGWVLALRSGRASLASAAPAAVVLLPPAWTRFEPVVLVAAATRAGVSARALRCAGGGGVPRARDWAVDHLLEGAEVPGHMEAVMTDRHPRTVEHIPLTSRFSPALSSSTGGPARRCAPSRG